MRITKLLSLDSEPAKPILDRAKPIALAFLERIKPVSYTHLTLPTNSLV